MNKNILFKCLGCGECCEQLLDGTSGRILGLMLLPKERELFSPEIVRPCMGFDNDRAITLSPTHIAFYQLTVNTCPHRTNENQCGIYSKRPLVCKAFPLSIQYPGSLEPNIPTYCNALRNLIPPEKHPKFNILAKQEWVAYKSLLNHIVTAFNNNKFISLFDLTTHSWGSKLPIFDDMRLRK